MDASQGGGGGHSEAYGRRRQRSEALLDQNTGQPIGAGGAFVRDLMHIADSIFYIGFILAAFDDKVQTFADKWKQTVVVAR